MITPEHYGYVVFAPLDRATEAKLPPGFEEMSRNWGKFEPGIVALGGHICRRARSGV
jgi:hypothetical protein